MTPAPAPELQPVSMGGEGHVELPAGTAWAAAHFRVPAGSWSEEGNAHSIRFEVTSERAVAEAAASFLFFVGEEGRLKLISPVPRLADWRFGFTTTAEPEDREFVILFVAEGLDAPVRLRIAPSTASAEGRKGLSEDLVVARGDGASLSIYTEAAENGTVRTLAHRVEVEDTRPGTALPAATVLGPGELRLSAARPSDRAGFQVAFFSTAGAAPRAGAVRYERAVEDDARAESRVLLPLRDDLWGWWSAVGRSVEERLVIRTESPDVGSTVTLISASTGWDLAAHGLAPDEEMEVHGGVEPPARLSGQDGHDLAPLDALPKVAGGRPPR